MNYAILLFKFNVSKGCIPIHPKVLFYTAFLSIRPVQLFYILSFTIKLQLGISSTIKKKSSKNKRISFLSDD